MGQNNVVFRSRQGQCWSTRLVTPLEMTSAISLQDPSGAVVGTPHYMAPEVLQGKPAGTAADVWALGITCLQLLTGALWMEATNVFAVLYAIGTMVEPPEISEEVPHTARVFVTQCLMMDPEARPGADELLHNQFLI